MTDIRTLNGVDVRGKRVLLRADLNLPMKNGAITDDTRLARLIPTITDLIARGARVVVISHLGRPKGEVVGSLSLAPIAPALSKALGERPVVFVPGCVGPIAESSTARLADGDVALLENLRFDPGEEKNDLAFARQLARLGDIYVNDAFSCSHRAHASTVAITTLLPSYGGPQVIAELTALERVLERPEKPVAALVGGAKVSSKLAILENLVHRVDTLIIGGGMANTFLFALGRNVGRSLCEVDLAEAARKIMRTASEAGCAVVLPTDVAVAPALSEGVRYEYAHVGSVPSDQMILDIGPGSVNALVRLLEACRTVLWNGPLGAFEVHPFEAGTRAVAQKAAELTQAGHLTTVAGGGDTVAALSQASVVDKFTYVSTAGGAFLKWLEGKELPGIAVLRRTA
ncbi:MAG: phosphoglycerate kinase [Rhodospirillales bacterium]|nr:phosphoglycerate kinase [Rhodospirillales bacterium]